MFKIYQFDPEHPVIYYNFSDEWGMDDPPYLLMARVAEMWLSGNLSQGKDPQHAGDLYTQAADLAMASMKGKLANKYYMLAEEAWGEVEEWSTFSLGILYL